MPAILWYSANMRNEKGQFIKGQRASRETEFKPGHHWRKERPHWNREWLFNEYVLHGRSATEIASEMGCTENNILYFLHKHEIPVRSISEARQLKHWGASGKDNPMYGRSGASNPNWQGGITAERQSLYASREWKKAVRQVWKRDRATCRRCGRVARKHGHFHVHHMVSFATESLRIHLDNLLLVCKPCHSWIHSRKNIDGDFLKGGDAKWR